MAIAPIPLFSGTPPNRNQPQSEFNTNVANWVSYTTTIQTNFNVFGAQANALAVEVGGYKDLALTYSNSASASATAAEVSASAVGYKGLWSAQTGAATKPYSVSHNGGFWALNNNLANVAASEPSITNADWQFVSGTSWQKTVTTSGALAKNAMWPILATSAPVDRTLPAMTDGDFIVVHNDPTSTQTVRVMNAGYNIRSAQRTITGADNIVLAAGETVYLQCRSSTELKVIS